MKLEIKEVHFNYGSISALENVTIKVERGEIVSLVGPNGSGKTTLLKCINKILKPKKGTILVQGVDVRKKSFKELAKFIGYIPQSTPASFPLSVFDVVLLGRKPYVNWGVSDRDKEIVSEMLDAMGLKDLALRMIDELSGGEKQKVILARALAQEPEVLLLDEPTSNLDLRHQLEILNLVSGMVKEKGLSAIMAIHDLNLASRFSDKVVMLKEGKIYAAGEVELVLTQENIKETYRVEVMINNDSGRPHIIALSPS